METSHTSSSRISISYRSVRWNSILNLKEFITLDGMEAKVVLKATGLAADNGKRNFSTYSERF